MEVVQLDDPLEAGLQVAILFEHPVILVADGLLDSDDLAADFVVEFGGVGISRPVGEHRLRPAPLLPGPGHSDDFDPCTWHWRWPPSWPPSTPLPEPPGSPIWGAGSISSSAPSAAARAIPSSPAPSRVTPRATGTEPKHLSGLDARPRVDTLPTWPEGALVPHNPQPFFRPAQTFLELLAVAHATPVLRLAEFSHCIDRFAGRSLGLERHDGGCHTCRSAYAFDGFEATPEVAPNAFAEAKDAFENRASERYGRMAPVVGRLAEDPGCGDRA